MEQFIIEQLSFQVDIERLFKTIRLDQEGDDADIVMQMVYEAQKIARPKAFYSVAYIEEKKDNSITIDGVLFESRVMRVNLNDTHRVFLYVATCGTELEEWSRSHADILEAYWADAIMLQALHTALKACECHIDEHFAPGKSAKMSPGSLQDWPIVEQEKLFGLLGDVKNAIGVTLTDSCLMIPAKSVSGIRFPTEYSFESCQLCPKLECLGRRAPYDSTLLEGRYK